MSALTLTFAGVTPCETLTCSHEPPLEVAVVADQDWLLWQPRATPMLSDWLAGEAAPCCPLKPMLLDESASVQAGVTVRLT